MGNSFTILKEEEEVAREGYEIVEYPHGNSEPISLVIFATRKMGMGLSSMDITEDMMRQKQQYVMSCVAGYQLLPNYIHETGNIDIQFNAIKMMNDKRKNEEIQMVFTSTAEFPYAGILKTYEMAGLYVLLEDGTYYLWRYGNTIKGRQFGRRMKRHIKRTAEEAHYISETASSSTLFRYLWNSKGENVSSHHLLQSEIGARDDKTRV